MRQKKGFALILVLLFTAIVLIVITAISLAIVSDVKLTSQSKTITETYSLARSGINNGWTAYLQQASNVESGVSGASISSIPSDNEVNIYYNDPTDGYKTIKKSQSDLVNWKNSNSDVLVAGVYIYQVKCSGGVCDNILSTGYKNGRKITLKAKITDNSGNSIGNGIHNKDTIRIYQTSESF